MPDDLRTVRLEVDADVDPGDRADLLRRLRRELLDLDQVDSIESPRGADVPRAKNAGIDLQTLIVTLAASGGVLTTLIGAVQAWLRRHERASVTLEIGKDKLVVKGSSPEAQQRLVDLWIERHSRER